MGCLPGLNESHLPGLLPHSMDDGGVSYSSFSFPSDEDKDGPAFPLSAAAASFFSIFHLMGSHCWGSSGGSMHPGYLCGSRDLLGLAKCWLGGFCIHWRQANMAGSVVGLTWRHSRMHIQGANSLCSSASLSQRLVQWRGGMSVWALCAPQAAVGRAGKGRRGSFKLHQLG